MMITVDNKYLLAGLIIISLSILGAGYLIGQVDLDVIVKGDNNVIEAEKD